MKARSWKDIVIVCLTFAHHQHHHVNVYPKSFQLNYAAFTTGLKSLKSYPDDLIKSIHYSMYFETSDNYLKEKDLASEMKYLYLKR